MQGNSVENAQVMAASGSQMQKVKHVPALHSRMPSDSESTVATHNGWELSACCPFPLMQKNMIAFGIQRMLKPKLHTGILF